MAHKQRKPGYTDEELRSHWSQAIPPGGVLHEYLIRCCMRSVSGTTEFTRGLAEGERRQAAAILALAGYEGLAAAQELPIKEG